jgi:glycosyltransferase involved in cell wall biosynthesis
MMGRNVPASGQLKQVSRVPAVSVIIPSYNVSRYIGPTLQSVFAQTSHDYEVIVVNDGSPDTDEFRNAIAGFRDRIIVVEQPNEGPAAARNTGIRLARGEFIAFLDGDDLWDPDYLDQELRRLRGDGEIDLLYSDARLFGTRSVQGRTLMALCPSAGQADLSALVSGSCTVFTSFTLVRRSAVIAVGGFDETMRFAEDFHLWIRLAYTGSRIAYTTDVLGSYRVRAGSQSTNLVPHCRHVLRALEDLAEQEITPQVRKEVTERWEKVWQEMRTVEGKRALLRREFGIAHAALADASTTSWKVRAALVGIRRLPILAYIGCHCWSRLLRVRSVLRSLIPAA